MGEGRSMMNNSVPPGKPYVYAFSSGRLVLLVCIVLVLISLSFMLGIRIERYQQSARPVIYETARTLPSAAAAPTQPVPETAPEPAEIAPAAPPSLEEAKTGQVAESPSVAEATVEDVAPETKPIEPAEKPVEKKPVPEAPKPVAQKEIVAPAPKPVEKKIAAPAPKPPAPEPKKVETSRLHYAVQVAASQDKTQAEFQKEVLGRKGFTSYIEVIDLPQKGRFYRVMVGPFKTDTEARSARSQLAKDPTFADCYVRYLP